MATDIATQVRGIGSAVLMPLLDFARKQCPDVLWLDTDALLEAATALYDKFGFKKLEDEEIWPTRYDRCTLKMVLEL
ncbi:MAG: GNAT family N-acetyltransferase [Proteobacteria bacterium]|nr:GNAT family N-acetyltransferase [Pseudomonadota bacterium]MDA0914082.1 GNAT family N-acetyltransferase [Pseudomonadota bacterium]